MTMMKLAGLILSVLVVVFLWLKYTIHICIVYSPLCRPPQFPLTSPNRRSSPATVSPSAPIEAYLSLAAMATLYLPQG